MSKIIWFFLNFLMEEYKFRSTFVVIGIFLITSIFKSPYFLKCSSILTARHYFNCQNLVISFDYCWFLAINLPNFVSLPWNSTTGIAIRTRSLHNVVKYFWKEHNLRFHDQFLQFSYHHTNSKNVSKYPVKTCQKNYLFVFGVVAWLLEILISQSAGAWSFKHPRYHAREVNRLSRLYKIFHFIVDCFTQIPYFRE